MFFFSLVIHEYFGSWSKTVCVEKSEVYQAEQISKLGMEVVEVDFRDVYPFGGGLHCSTTDVYREGKCEDYFPKQ